MNDVCPKVGAPAVPVVALAAANGLVDDGKRLEA